MPLFEVELEDGKTYEIDSEREPTHDEVYAALGFKRDTGESRLESFAQKIPQTIVGDVAGGFVKAPGAVASIIPGMEDNVSLRAGDAIKNFAKEAFPVNPLYEDEPQQDVASAIGQGIGMILPAGAASKIGMGEKALEIMGLTEAGALGATGGQETADQYGVTNPLGRANLILGGAAREAGTEMMGGFGSKQFSKALAGDIMTVLKGQGLKQAAKTVGSEGLEEVVSGLIEPIQTRLATSGLSGLSTDTTTAENGQPLPALPWTMQGVKDVAWQGLMGGVGGAVFALPQYVQLKSTPKLNQAIPLYLATKQHIDELKAEGKDIPQELDDNFTMLDSYVQANGAKAAVNYAATLKEFTDDNTPEERKAELGQILSGYESGILEVAPDEVDDFRAKILSNPDLDQDIRDAASVAQYVTADDDPTGAVLEGLQSSIEQLKANPVVQAASPTSPARQEAKVAAQQAKAQAATVETAALVGPETVSAVAATTTPAPSTTPVAAPAQTAVGLFSDFTPERFEKAGLGKYAAMLRSGQQKLTPEAVIKLLYHELRNAPNGTYGFDNSADAVTGAETATTKVKNEGGWHYRQPKTGTKWKVTDRISANVAFSPEMIAKLDEFFARTDVGYYKTPEQGASWSDRHDPITAYLSRKLTPSERAEFISIVGPNIRQGPTTNDLAGTKIAEGVFEETSPQTHELEALIKRAEAISPQFGSDVRKYFSDQFNPGKLKTSAGGVTAVTRALEAAEKSPTSTSSVSVTPEAAPSVAAPTHAAPSESVAPTPPKPTGESTPARTANRAPFYVPKAGPALEKVKTEAFKALRRLYGKKARGVTEGSGPGQVTFTTSGEYAATLPENDPLRIRIENSNGEAFVNKDGRIIVFTDRVHVYPHEVVKARKAGILPQSYALARLLAHEGTHPLTGAIQRQRASVAQMSPEEQKAWKEANPAVAKLLDGYDQIVEDFRGDWEKIRAAFRREPGLSTDLLRGLDENFAAERRRLDADVKNAKTATDRLEAQRRRDERLDLMEAVAKVEVENRFGELSDDQVDWLVDEFISVMAEQDLNALEKAYGKDKGIIGRIWDWMKRVFNTAIGNDPDAPVDLGRMGNFLREAQNILTDTANGDVGGERFSTAKAAELAPQFSEELQQLNKDDEESFFSTFWPMLLKKAGLNLKPSFQNLNRAADIAVNDVAEWLKNNPRYLDYYHTDWNLTKNLLKDAFPDLTDDEITAFRLFTGLTSPNTSLPNNMADAVRVLDLWRKKGTLSDFKLQFSPKGNRQMVSSPFILSGTTGPVKAFALHVIEKLHSQLGSWDAVLNKLRDTVDYKQLHAFNKEMGFLGPVGDIGKVRAVVQEATGQEDQLPRMFIFGPKVGAYTLNSTGDDRFTTTDIWEARFIRSHFPQMFQQGTGLPTYREEGELFQMFASRFNQKIRAALGQELSPSALQAARWFYMIQKSAQAGYRYAKTTGTISDYTRDAIERYIKPDAAGSDNAGGRRVYSGASTGSEERKTAATLAGGLGGGVLEDRFSTPSTDEQKDPFTQAPTEFHGRAVSPDQASRAYERLAALGSPDGKTRSEIAAAHGEIPEQARILSEWLESKGYEPIDVHRTFDAVPVRYGDDIVTNLKGGKFNELGKGAEGSVLEPTGDPSVVYKVFVPWEGEDTGFGIKPHMQLKDGKLLVWNYAGDIFNPIEKSRFIAGIGGVPQEFHGVDPDGYLVMKMPKGTPAPDEYDSTDQRLMQEFPDPTARPQLGSPEFKAILKEERTAINSKMEATIKDHGLRRVGKEEGIVTPRSMQGNDQNTPYLAVLDGVPYLVTDVRFENVLQDNQNQIRISDAAVSQLEPQFYEHLPKLKKLVKEMIANEPEGRAEARFSTPLAQAGSSATLEDDQGAKAGEDQGDGRANLRPGRRDGAGAPVDWRGKRIQLTHWSFNPSLKSSDPGKHGTGGIGAEKSRKRDYPKLYVDRTYFGYGKYRREQFIGGERYTTEVDGSKIYDLDRDPLDLYPDSKELRAAGFAPFDQQAAITMFENRMKEAGFSGYRSKNSNAVALFDKAKLTKVNNSDKSEPPIADRFSTPESTNKENENADTGTTQGGGPQARSEAGGLQDGGRVAGGSGVLEKPGGPLAAGEPLRGLTGKAANIDIPGRGVVKFGPFETAREVARKYMEDVGLPYHPPTTYQKVDPKRAARIADEYEKMAHDPSNPEVAAAYKAMIDETIAQWNAIMKTGLKVEPMVPGEDPYAATPRMAVLDVIENNHMWFFPTSSGFGSGNKISDNPLEATKTGVVINGMELVANDMFRVVHDYFGHIKEGVGFRADGEENAWRSHSAMYSPLARKAMTTETRGQNSWLNFGPYGEKNRTAQTAETVFAPQKIGLLPEWVVNEASGDVEHEIKFSEARFSTPSDPIAAAFRTNMVMKPLLDSTGSGPFDGGCLVVAKALQRVLGGSIIRMQSWRGDEHYGVRMPDGSVYDGDGKIGSEKLWIARIEQNEGVQEQMWIEEGLPVDESPTPVDDPRAVDAVADALERYLKQYHGIGGEKEDKFSTPLPSSAGRYDRTSWTDNSVAEWMQQANEAKYNELVEWAQTMGTRTQNKYLREGVGVMTDFVRRELAGLVDDGESEVKLDPVTGQVMELPPIDDAHVSQYIKLARKILTNKTFARKFKERFQKYHADTVEAHVNRRKVTSAIDAETGQMETMTKEWLEHKDYAVHKGSAVVAVLQLELMNIAQRLALTLDTKGKHPGTPEYNHEMRKLELMQMLMPAANDTIIGDYMTIRDAARSLQVRSMAVQGKGFWRAIKLIDRARQEAAMETGKKEGMTAKQISDLIQSLSSELNLNVIPEIVKGNLVYDKVEELLQAAMDNQAAQIKATEEEEQDWWSQAVKTFSDEEQELLDAFKVLMEDIANDAKLIGEVPGPGKSSVPDPGSERSHEDIVKGLVEKRARAMALLKKLVTVQTKNAARISKELRKKILNDKRLALLKPDPQGQKLIDQYLNAPKVKARAKEENPVKDAFIKQVREPVPEEEFVLKLQKLGMSKETAYNLASVARDQIEEKRERDAELNAPKIAKAEAKRVAADLQKYYREIEKAEKQEAALIERLAKERQKEQAKQDKKAQADLEKEIRETQKEKEKAQREAERLSNIPTDIAQSIIDQIDEEKTEWLPPDAKRAPEVQRLKRAALVDARTAPGVIGGLTRERFIEQYSKAFRDAGVKDAAAHTLATRLYEENIKLASNRVMSKRARMEKSRKFLEALIKNIYSTSISAKSSGTYAEEQAVEAFRAVGMTEATAKQAAAGLSLAVRQAQQKAQMEALERAAAKLKLNNPTIETLKGAIRSGLFNPADPVASALAKLSGFKELSLDDYKRLAEADDMSRGTSSEAAKGQSIMLSIMRKSDPPKKIRDMIYSAWVPDAISGLSNYMLNLTSPAFAALRINGLRVVEIMSDAARGKTDFGQTAARLARLVTSFNRSMREMVDQMRFAAVHDAYKNRMAEHVRNMDALLGQGEKAIEIFRAGMKNHDPVKVLEGSVRWVYSTVNLIRRSFSTIDQAWASGLARQTFEYEAYRELFSNAKIRPAEAAAMMAEADTQAENGLNAKQLAREKAGATPMDTATQNAVKHDLFREALLTQMRDRFGVESAEQMAVAADKDADMELGNRDSETAPNWDVFNNIIEMVKKAAIAMRRVDSKDKKSGPFVTALSHMITGFLSVPGNVLNRSFYFTPVGILRASSKLREFKNDELTSHYNETMATRRQAETRMLEGIIGTILMVAYMALKLAGKKDDEDKNEWGFDINGAGPKDPKLREAWLKKGHRQNAMELRTPWGFASIPWGRGGFEGISMMMLPMAAVKDMQLNGIDPAKGENIGRYAGAMANAFASQAKFFGAKDSASGLTSTDQQVVGGLTYSASPFLPFSGLLKSITKALGEDSPMERSSPTTAFWSSVPVAGVAGTARINAFGDQMGDLDWMNRAWFSGFPLALSSGYSPSNDDLYSYVLQSGIAPAIPNRGNLERTNGEITDEKWFEYAKTRGEIVKKEMKKELHKLLFMDRKDAENAVEKLGADATREAKKRLKLK